MTIVDGAAYVVDTNVAIVANGKSDHVDAQCVRSSIDALEAVGRKGVVAVDDRGLIVEEYRRRLHPGGPGVGNSFFKHVHDNQWTGTRVRRVPITPADEGRGFRELPPNRLDPSDRKFLATAVAGKAEILNAADSDWVEHADLTRQVRVAVRQICPQHARKPGARQ